MSSTTKDNNIKIDTMHGADQGHNCGYCKNKTGSFTYGFDSPSMSSEFYKSLMDSGWRRCGTYFYKPNMFASCCKSYTIRMNACEFQIKKSQKKVMKKWNNFIYSNKSIQSVLEAEQNESAKPKSSSMIPEANLETQKVDYSGQSDSQIELLNSVKAIAAELESEWKEKLNYFKDNFAQISFLKPEILKSVKILPQKCEKKGQFFTNYFMMFNSINRAIMPSINFKSLFQELSPILNELLAKHIVNFTSVVDTHSGQVNFFNKEKKIEPIETNDRNGEEIQRINEQQTALLIDDFNMSSFNKEKQFESLEKKEESQEESSKIEQEEEIPKVQGEDNLNKNDEIEQLNIKNENLEEGTSKMQEEEKEITSMNQEEKPSNEKEIEQFQTNNEVVEEPQKIQEEPQKIQEEAKTKKEEENQSIKEQGTQLSSQDKEKKSKHSKIRKDETEIKSKESPIGESNPAKKAAETDSSSNSLIRRGRLTIKIEIAKANQTNFGMYKRYCAEFHEKEKENYEAFKGFLCENTLNIKIRTSETDQSKKLYLGCFHMNYYIDDEFFAVGVVDFFEEGLSSVYFFYEPKWKKFSPGVIGAIYEIEYLRLLNEHFPKYKYYYLGFYIQNCQKMVYKGDYAPAELLCPRTYKWVELDERIRKLIDSNPKDPSLSSAGVEVDPRMSQSELSQKNLEKYVEVNTKTQLQDQAMSFKQFSQFFQARLKQIFYAFASIIDKDTYSTILFSYSKQ